MNAECKEGGSRAVCECRDGYEGDPFVRYDVDVFHYCMQKQKRVLHDYWKPDMEFSLFSCQLVLINKDFFLLYLDWSR